jgi:hypothetical protein
MTHAATAADRLLYAARVRRLPAIIINYGYGRDAVVSSSVLFQQQVFISKYGTEQFHNPHPLSPSMLNKLITHNLLPDLLDHPGNCCCSLPFKQRRPMTTKEKGVKRIFIDEAAACHFNCDQIVIDEELSRSLRCICTTDTASAFYKLPLSETALQQQDMDYTCVKPPDFISEEHKRPCNALQDLSITHFELPDVFSVESQPTLPTSARLGAKTI